MSSSSAGGNSSADSSVRDTQRTSCPSTGVGCPCRVARKEMQLDQSFRIGVCGREDFLSDVDLAPELFADFARQTSLERFPAVAFPTGKFPHPTEVHSGWTSRHEVRSVALDDGSGDHDTRHVT